MKSLQTLLAALAITGAGALFVTPPHDPVSSTQGLVSRVLGPQYVAAFSVAVIPPDAATGRDAFEIGAALDPTAAAVQLSGSNGVALASALGFYLKYSLNASWGFGVNNTGHQTSTIPPPEALPTPAASRFVSPALYRYSYNTCTFGYSFAFYDEARWQQEIDRAAMYGINAPLMPIGLEFAEAAVYSAMGLTDAELAAWFTGHSHLPWQRMANIKGIAGPLPAASLAQQAALGAAVAGMMRAFGMVPVLPGFAGHVPDALRRLYPTANISASSDWGGVGCVYSCDGLLEASDPLFPTLGAALNAKVLELFGQGLPAPLFNADTFNEESPSSGDAAYLAEWNRAVYGAMLSANENSTYVMQAWCFHSSFWTPERVQAYLSPVPLGRMLVLDLNSEDGPVWEQFDSFYGHDWAWCGLIVFGGRRAVYGNLPVLAASPFSARASSPSLVGLGITPEAIDQCQAAFDILLEACWRSEPIADVSSWLQAWAGRRYGFAAGSASAALVAEAYSILESAAFRAGGPDLSVYEKLPALTSGMSRGTNASGVLEAARLLLAAGVAGGAPASSTLRYDLVDFVRQAACAMHADRAALLSARFLAGPGNASASSAAAVIAAIGASMDGLLADLDAFLSVDPNFMLGSFVEPARAMGVAVGNESLFVRDAKLLVSLWTLDGLAFGGLINDYSSRNGFAGLVGTYYAPRWALFEQRLAAATALGGPSFLNETQFLEDLLAFELAWTVDTATVFPTMPPAGADAFAAAAAFLDRFAPAASAPGNVLDAFERRDGFTLAPPASPPPPNGSAAWVLLGRDQAAVGDDCPYLAEPTGIATVAACEAACDANGECNVINFDAAAPYCVFRRCSDPLLAQLSPNAGYDCYAKNTSGVPIVSVSSALASTPGAMAATCLADALCTGFDSSGSIVEGAWTLQAAGAGATAWLRRSA
jgi:alpha-N-acetylglucosaminidase